MNELEVAGHRYQVSKLDVIKQFHIARRLGPVLVVAGVTVDMLRQGMRVDANDLVAMAGPVMQVVSQMTDEESQYILLSCLSACKRLEASSWAPMVTPDGKQLLYQNMELPEMLRIVCEVLKVNLGNFLTELGVVPTSQSS